MNVYLAIFIASLVSSMVIGFVWYGPLFGKTWMKLAGISEKDMANAKKGGMAKTYGLSFAFSILMSFILANLIKVLGADTLQQGMLLGLILWLGFVGTTHGVHMLYEKKPFKLYLINIGYHFVELLIMGGLLAVLL